MPDGFFLRKSGNYFPTLMLIHWRAGPELLDLGPLHLRWYGILFATGFYLGYRITGVIFDRMGKGQKDLDRFFLYVFLSTLIGARLGHCLFYEPSVYLPAPWKILAIWEGGLASHGAFIGIAIACALYARKERGTRNPISGLMAFDILCVTAPLAGAMIRIGNFFNSEIIGKPTGADWGVVFERVDSVPRHPGQLYESAVYFVLFGIQMFLWKKKRLLDHTGRSTGVFMVVVFTARFCLEFLKENQVGFEAGMPINMGQVLSIPLVLIGFGLLLRRNNASQ